MSDYRRRLSQEQQQLQQKIQVRLIEMGAPGLLLTALAEQGLDGIAGQLDQFPDRQLYGLCQRLTQVEAALCQLDLGLYGICCDCEAEIELDRLAADPAEQRCARCTGSRV
ncbi:TraR/DksA family transcriptional regulator [Gallaecimonas xiamenensis]|uniref:TraR/DksA family transcriptional regulator n=1 Tax=Gallaecimonas xiamenensis 3-C-1 TaxID=745411 RepID=K2IFG8_9GAMM|nr:TraR/DksA C4-type zinc finger protein [Gallaecimonas xiamenensis]EKE68751.1 TraR/DksA family transcriptional regulator [Gallaecimonas xiamenensis 3-C-1]